VDMFSSVLRERKEKLAQSIQPLQSGAFVSIDEKR
jgi:hypothetical protein